MTRDLPSKDIVLSQQAIAIHQHFTRLFAEHGVHGSGEANVASELVGLERDVLGYHTQMGAAALITMCGDVR